MPRYCLFRCAASPLVETPTHATKGSQSIHVLRNQQTTLCGRNVKNEGLARGVAEGLEGHSDACTRCQQLKD